MALAIALVLAVQPTWPDRSAIAVTLAIALTFAAAARWQLRWLPVLVLLGCAMVLRLSMLGQEVSDVSDVTSVAIMTMQYGGDPYGQGYIASRPMGAPFPYGPVALLWYLPVVLDPAFMELLVSIGLLLYFGLRAGNGRPLGLALFAVAPPIVLATMDGSNDTSAGFFILVSLVLASTHPRLGAVALAVAVAFKAYAVAWLVPLVLWAGLPTLFAFLAASVIAWAPVLFVWGPASYLRSLAMAQEVHLRQAYWSLGAILNGIAPDAVARGLESLRYVVAGAVAVIGSRRIRSIDGVIVVGTAVFVIAQFGGYFGSFVYFAAIAPILCWRIDDWLHRALPDLSRAYGEVPELARRARRSAAASASAAGSGGVSPAGTFAAHPGMGRARFARTGPAPRERTARPSRNPAA